MIKIGITGHRELEEKHIAKYGSEILTQLISKQKQYGKVVVLSLLADGADRLIVHQALKLNIDFIAVLPLALNEYEKDFTCKSKDEFYHLLSKAKKIITLENKYKNRDFSYEKAGHFVSDNSNILFALWDGKHTGLKGGTSEIVKYHLRKNKKLWHLKALRNDI